MLATPDLIRESALPAQLAEQLPRWLSTVPLYRHSRADAPFPGEIPSLEAFRQLPLITKTDIRRGFPGNFLPGDLELEDLLERDEVELEHTSGTSEIRTPLLLPAGWWREQETDALRLNPKVARVLDEFPEARRVVISSPVCSGEICYTGVPSLSERTLGNSLYTSLSRLPFLWSEADLARMAAEAVAWEPLFLDVDPVYGVIFALYCERNRIRLPSLQFILCSYEFVSVAHRQVLERVFGVPIFNLYGSTETGHLMMENSSGLLRPSLQTAYLEIVDKGVDGIGNLVVSTLTNDYMPLIRYRIGDLVEARPDSCRTHYIVHGRLIDAVHRAGRRITTWQVDQCFAGVAGVVHYQLAQTADGFVLQYVADPVAKLNPNTARDLTDRLRQVVHEPVTMKQQSILMPESSGKFRLLVPLPHAR